MVEGEENEDRLVAQKVAGVALAVILAVSGVVATGWGDASVEPRMETFAREAPGMIFWWREDVGPLFALGVALILAPIVLVPGAFGVGPRRILPTLPPRWRAVLVLGLAAAIGAEAVAYRFLGGRDIGVATIDGVQWLRDGAPLDHWRWAQATRITGGCSTHRRSGADPTYDVEYRVHFPGKREARLLFIADAPTTWAANLQPIDDKLTTAGVKRSMESDADCLAHYQDSMIDVDRDRFQRVLRPAGG